MSSTDTPALNVLGEPLDVCGCQPMTGWYRDGSCRTDGSDLGRHTVCCVVDERFLSYSRAQGNDLSTPMPTRTAWLRRCGWRPASRAASR